MQKIKAYMLIVVAVLLILVYKPLIVFFVPGLLLLLFTNNNESKNDIKTDTNILSYRLLQTIGISIAYWIITIWFIDFLNITLLNFVYATIFICILAIGYDWTYRRKKGLFSEILVDKSYILIILTIILAIRIVPFFLLLAAPGNDMTAQAYITRLLVEKDGLPDTFEPLVPVKHFGAYATGFHAISAIMSLFGHMEVYRSTLLLSTLIYFFISLAIFRLARKYFSDSIAITATLIASFLTTYPQMVFRWGGNLTVFSLFFVILGFIGLETIIERLKQNGLGNKEISYSIVVYDILFTVVMLVASFLTHLIPFITFFYTFLFYLMFEYAMNLMHKKDIRRLRYLKTLTLILVIICIISLVLLLPYLLNLKFTLSDKDIEILRYKAIDHLILPSISFPPVIKDIIVSIIQIIASLGIPLFFLSFFGFLIGYIRGKSIALKYLILAFGPFILLINSQYFILPGTLVLFTDRITLVLLIPFTIFTALLLDEISKKIKSNYIIAIIGIYILITVSFIAVNLEVTFDSSPYNINRQSVGIKEVARLAFFQAFAGPTLLYALGSREDNSLTYADLDAIRWIEANTEKTDIFLNNHHDAGRWIPSIAFRPIFFSIVPKPYQSDAIEYYNKKAGDSGVNPTMIPKRIIDDSTLNNIRLLKALDIRYAYIGSKPLYGEQYFKDADFEQYPEIYKKIYDISNVKIYKVLLN